MKRLGKTRTALLAYAAVLALVVGPGTAGQAADVPETTLDAVNKRQVVEVFDAINEFRLSEGLAPLRFNATISEMAEDQADRQVAAGSVEADPLFADDGRVTGRWTVASQIVAARSDTSGYGLVDQWLETEENRRILSSPDYQHVGIGVSKSGNDYSLHGTVNLFQFAEDQVPAGGHDSPAGFFAGAGLPWKDRVAGQTLYDTAVEISKAGFPDRARVVYLATGANFPDALVAAPAAAKEGGPVLLTQPKKLPANVKEELRRLNPDSVVVVGGELAIDAAVFNEVKSVVPNTVRRGGQTLYDTARLVVDASFESAETAYIATGVNFPDALSSATVAGAAGQPVLLVRGKDAQVDPQTVELLTSLGTRRTVVVGGPLAITEGIERSLAAFAPTRIGGQTLYDTSRMLNEQLAQDADRVYLATGLNYPDALAGAAVAGPEGAPMFLVPKNCVPQGVLDAIDRSASRVTLLGGELALTAEVGRLEACQ